MVKLRLRLLVLWLICLITAPLLLLAMLAQCLLGSEKRALVVLLAFDKNGNYACGGSKNKSVSGQVGRAMLQNATWAIYFAKLIDLLMGEDHCKATAIKVAK